MRIFNFNRANLESFLVSASLLDIELGINNEGDFEINNWSQFKDEISLIQRYYLEQKNSIEIESIPPFETHPYVQINQSPNNKYHTLILGTFPPPSYLHQQYPNLSNGNLLKGIDIDITPPLYYFYGNRGSLWDILDVKLDQNTIYQYLENKGVLISDIILFAQRKSLTKKRAADDNYVNIIPNIPIINFLFKQENSIKNIVFTSKQWKLTDGIGRGRRSKNYVPDSILFSEENSAISLFLRSLLALGVQFAFQKMGSDEIVDVVPRNFNRINDEFTDLFAFNLIMNERVFLLNIGDSPSGNAFTPFDSSSFMRWIKNNYGEQGIQVLKNHPRNSKNDQEKRTRKAPIQRDLNYPEGRDICNDFQKDMYSMFLQRDFYQIQQIQNQAL